jgi:Phosphate/sulphate permeases
MLLFSFILITILAGWWLGTIEIPAGFSGLIATGAIRTRYMGIGIIFFIIIGACFFSNQLSTEYISKISLTTQGSAVIIVFSAFLAVLLTYRLSKYSSICYGVIGASIAWNFFIYSTINYTVLLKVIITWLLIPVLSGLIAASLYLIYRFFIVKSNIHLLLLIRYLMVGILIAATLFAICIGINNGALLIALNETISPGFNFSWNAIDMNENHILLIVSILIITMICYRKAVNRIEAMAEGEFDANVETILITLISGVLIISFFSIPTICKSAGLIAIPVSISAIIVGGLTGINLVKKGHSTEYTEEYRMLISTLATPLAAFIITFLILNIVDTQTLLPESAKSIHQRNTINITPVITTVLSLAFTTFIIIFLRKQRRIRIQSEIILLESQNKLFENQKALSALEVKTVITENELLHDKLELRRKELINIALGITEQKNFQEDLYQEIKQLKEQDDLQKLKQGIDNIEKQLLRKMNYSQELESFYAQIESLHKDFNMRLTEKYPNLTEQERRLTTLLRLGFSSKHIGSLMNISPKSVEMSRYRLRNRLGLDHDQKLITFIKNI